MNIHFLHFVTVEFILDLLRELWCQTITRSWFAPPIIYFGMEGVVDGTFWCPVDVPLLHGRRRCRSMRLGSAWQVEAHAGEYRSGLIQSRMRIGKVETVRQRFAIDVAFKGRKRLRERIIAGIMLVVFAIELIRVARGDLGEWPRLSMIRVFGGDGSNTRPLLGTGRVRCRVEGRCS